jgi:hypothetical protein
VYCPFILHVRLPRSSNTEWRVFERIQRQFPDARLTRVMLQPCTERRDWIQEQVPSDGRVLRGKQLECSPIPWSTILRYWKISSTPSSVHTTIHTVCQLVIGSSSTHKWFHSAVEQLTQSMSARTSHSRQTLVRGPYYEHRPVGDLYLQFT